LSVVAPQVSKIEVGIFDLQQRREEGRRPRTLDQGRLSFNRDVAEAGFSMECFGENAPFDELACEL
jgi:hypothetical protein